MAIQITIEPRGFDKVAKRLNDLQHQLHDMTPAMEEIGRYMVRSTQNRILSSKTAPGGSRWAGISRLTAELKGSEQIMFQSGDLYRSIKMRDASRDYVSVSSDQPYAGYMQEGVKRVRGKYRTKKPIPPRPFLGITDENKRRIAKIITQHISQHTEA